VIVVSRSVDEDRNIVCVVCERGRDSYKNLNKWGGKEMDDSIGCVWFMPKLAFERRNECLVLMYEIMK